MPKSALELAQHIHASRKDLPFWQTGLGELLVNETYQDLLSIAQADIEAAKIFLGSYSICQQLTALQKAQIIHHHRQNANFLTQLSEENGLLFQSGTSLHNIGRQDVNAARLILSSPEIISHLNAKQIAKMLRQHQDNIEFFQLINTLLAQTGTSLLTIALADQNPRGALQILSDSLLHPLLKTEFCNRMLNDPAFAADALNSSIGRGLLTPFEQAIFIVKHCHATWVVEGAFGKEEKFLEVLLKKPDGDKSSKIALLLTIVLADPHAAQLLLRSATIRQILGHHADGIINHWRDEFELARANRQANREFRHNLAEVQKFIQEYGESPYQALGIARDASPEQIREAYRVKNLANHPDRGSNNQTQAKLNAANPILTDAKKREILDRILKGCLGDFEARLITVRLLADSHVLQQAAANPETTTALNARQSALINHLIEQLQTEDQSDELPPEKTTAINALEALKTYTALGIELNQAKERIINEYSLFTLPRDLHLRIFATLAMMLEPKLSAAVNATDLSAKSDSEKAKLLVKEKPDIINQGISRTDMIFGALVFSFALLCAGIAIALTATGVFSPIGALFGITSLGTMALLATNGALGLGAGLLLGGLLTSAYSLFKDSSESAQAAPVKTTTPAMTKREATAVADSAVQGEQYGHVLHRTAPPPVKSNHAPGPNSPKP